MHKNVTVKHYKNAFDKRRVLHRRKKPLIGQGPLARSRRQGSFQRVFFRKFCLRYETCTKYFISQIKYKIMGNTNYVRNYELRQGLTE